MSSQYFTSLLIKSAEIQRAIEREGAARRPDWMRLLKLKKLRWVIKDRLQRLHLAHGGQVSYARVPVRSHSIARVV